VIPLRPVDDSSHIAAAGYDHGQQVMRVEFKSGKQYDYHGVTPEIYGAFLEAPSQGEYHAKVIRPSCPCAIVKEK
jgi:hypothetical protein